MARALHGSDWDKLYRGESDVVESPTCDIGEPQPELAALERAGKFRSEILDAGCGIGELSLYLAARGYQTVGVDFSAAAIERAKASAAEQNLRAEFVQADISKLSGYDNRFSTLVDGCMFHSLPLDLREGYLQSIARAAKPGASYFLITFAKEAAAPESEISRSTVSAEELASLVGRYFDVEEIRPALWSLVQSDYLSEVGFNITNATSDKHEKGHARIAAWLLVGHKPH